MLQVLTIQQFALIHELELEFGSGFHVLTGETGAGKSIIIDALNLALGDRASHDYIRTGEKEAQIHVFFDSSKNPSLKERLKESGYSAEEELLLSRHISLNGPNKSYINGRPSTLRLLKEIGSYLIEIHGQHHHQALLSREKHLYFLDSFGGKEVLSLYEETKSLFYQWQDVVERVEAFYEREEESKRRVELLTYQIEEIHGAHLTLGEDEDLRLRKKKLAGAQRLKEEAMASFQILEGEEGIEEPLLNSLGQVKNLLQGLKEIDEDLSEVYNLVQTGYLQLKEASYLLRDYLDTFDVDPEEILEVEERLMELASLKRKYGPSIEDILQYREEIEEELQRIKGREQTQEALYQEQERLEREYRKKAALLSLRRRETAAKLEDTIISILGDLKMEKVRFSVSFRETERPQATGLEQVEFLLSPNPGEDLKPLHRIASGGELSRIMLAFKASLPHLDSIDTLIFDEIDTGVGGETAHSIGEKIASLAKNHQVICVTHLPQIACMADRHYLIEKEVVQGRTSISVKELEQEERVEELARMLGSQEMTSTSFSHARELLERAREKRRVIRGSF